MSENHKAGPSPEAVEQTMRQELAHGDVILATSGPILRHLLASDQHMLFSDEVIATVRGMMLHISRQMLFALARQEGSNDPSAYASEREEDLALALLEDSEFLSHAHAITIEALIAHRLSQRSGIDTVLSPLLQELVATTDETVAADAMRVLAAQARFMQQQRRMELPLNELPNYLLDKALEHFSTLFGEATGAGNAAKAMRGDYDPEKRRVGQIVRLIAGMQHRAKRALEVDHAGVSIFVTALGMAADQKRDTVILSLSENQCARLAISLRAAGLGQAAVEEQFLYIHPEISMPDGFDTIRADRASAMLADAGIEGLS